MAALAACQLGNHIIGMHTHSHYLNKQIADKTAMTRMRHINRKFHVSHQQIRMRARYGSMTESPSADELKEKKAPANEFSLA